MSEINLSKAYEAAAASIDETFGERSYDVWPDFTDDGKQAIDKALPHILEAIAAQVEQGHPADRYTPSWTYEGARWLRARAGEARA